MNGNVVIWDIETIPDLRGFAAANYLTGKTDAEIREMMGDKFPKHIYHSILSTVLVHFSLIARTTIGLLTYSVRLTLARAKKN